MQRPDQNGHAGKRILVLGAYGLIGCGITRRLERDGYQVIGFGRDIDTGKRVLPSVSWRSGDLRCLTEESAWRPVLEGIDVVVNCSGALQDGPQDDLEAVHHHAISALAKACVFANVEIVQISAVGAVEGAETPFLASKARGDEAIKTSGVEFHIFRPGLVLAPHSYGGTTMLRMLAAFPLIQPIAMPDAKIQTIALDDVAEVVAAAIAGTIPNGFVGDLVETETHSLREVVRSMRGWLGFPPARVEVAIPGVLTQATAKIADSLAILGWRSPLRSTAMKVLADGVVGDPAKLAQFDVPPVKSLHQTLAEMPARAEDRLFASIALLTPVIIGTLVTFWFLSGVIGLFRMNAAASVLENVGWPHVLAVSSVLFWAIVDIGIAAAFAFRPYAKQACWLSVLVSLFYLGASTLFVPQLWMDPLGPLVKVLPAISLALVARITLESR